LILFSYFIDFVSFRYISFSYFTDFVSFRWISFSYFTDSVGFCFRFVSFRFFSFLSLPSPSSYIGLLNLDNFIFALNFYSLLFVCISFNVGGRRGRMVVGFTSTSATSDYHH